MGTSTPYFGPTGTSPLLPPWADGTTGPDDGSGLDADGGVPAAGPNPQPVPIQPSVNWATPKTGLTRWARGTGTRTLRPVVRNYVGASGGSRTAARAAGAGRASTGRLGRFLATGVQSGFAAATVALTGLRDLVGRDAQFVLAAVVDAIAPA